MRAYSSHCRHPHRRRRFGARSSAGWTHARSPGRAWPRARRACDVTGILLLLAKDKHALMPYELLVSDAVGRLIEFWGFKRNMGRVWAVLYLSPDPLSADDLRHALKISSGAVSMTLSELQRWGVVRKVWVQGERK